jgi:hypothetical protein
MSATENLNLIHLNNNVGIERMVISIEEDIDTILYYKQLQRVFGARRHIDKKFILWRNFIPRSSKSLMS